MTRLSKTKTKKIEDAHDRQLTDRQKTFAKFIVEGIYSNTECARKSGYSPNVAKKQACGLAAFTCARVPSVWVQHLRKSTNVSLLSAPSAEILNTIRKHHYSPHKTHIWGGHLPRLITFVATFLLQDSLRWLLLSSSRPLCGQCPQCKSSA